MAVENRPYFAQLESDVDRLKKAVNFLLKISLALFFVTEAIIIILAVQYGSATENGLTSLSRLFKIDAFYFILAILALFVTSSSSYCAYVQFKQSISTNTKNDDNT